MNSDLTWDLSVPSAHVQIHKYRPVHGYERMPIFSLYANLINKGQYLQIHVQRFSLKKHLSFGSCYS